jgi:hypothetical protein
MRYLLPFHCNNGCRNAPQCYVIHTLPAFLYPQLVPHREHCLSHPAYFHAFKRYYYCVTHSVTPGYYIGWIIIRTVAVIIIIIIIIIVFV